jgi:hypothetical protein
LYRYSKREQALEDFHAKIAARGAKAGEQVAANTVGAAQVECSLYIFQFSFHII